MRYKLLGRSGSRVSELSLGTMTFGEGWGWGASKTDYIDLLYLHMGKYITSVGEVMRGLDDLVRDGKVH